ncbi:MAG: cell division protein FtsQ, partial [Clostridia bacterium]|nr:cell division protein FtsQ [Clostridia bacterium]
PLALLGTHNKCVQSDAEGVYLGVGSYGDLGLPLINNQEITLGKPGEKIQGKNLDKILTGVAQIPSELREKISEINYTDEEGFVFYTLDGIQCRIGFPEDMSKKGQALLDILSNLQNQGHKVVYINMSYVGNPVVKYEE